MNRFILVLVVVVEAKPTIRGRERERRGRKGGSWRAPIRFFACIGTMNLICISRWMTN